MSENSNCKPNSPATEHCWLPNSRRSPGIARRLLRDLLARVPNGPQLADSGELVVSELVTNAWRHGTRPGQLIWLRLAVGPDGLLIEVHDASDARPELHPVGTDDESGRGLHLVEQLTREWGWGPRAGIGKRVWALCPPAPDDNSQAR
ncbi:ATP-binding protein [Kitasatospora sp. NBC_01266]|uniref:ATP-binding protein n=1 Tax=Kitasatospora sp. NBC_01266 TaxID=2903572 RepID=UPI002E32A748|nr:ATP-binding protein [Kitasatospora sp. NBC_01266]